MWYVYLTTLVLIASFVFVFITTAENTWDRTQERVFGCFIAFVFVAVVFGAAAVPVLRNTTGFWPDYSVGTREGYITKVSVKGIVYKTNEATMQIGTGAQAALQEPFAFSIPPEMAPQVEAALGKHVRITYSQYLMMPFKYGETDYLLTNIEVLN